MTDLSDLMAEMTRFFLAFLAGMTWRVFAGSMTRATQTFC